MKRRSVLGAVLAGSTAALAGCADRLGLVDRVDVRAKVVRGIDGEDETVLLERRFDPAAGPVYQGGVPEELRGEIDPSEPLTIDEELEGRLESDFEAIRYEMRACASLGDGEEPATDCRGTQVLRDDFNEIRVGDTVDVRYGEDVTGVVDVVDRHER